MVSSDDACLRREDAAAAGFRMISDGEARLRRRIGAAVLASTVVYTAAGLTDGAALLPQMMSGLGFGVLATGMMHQ